jgi:hypothetical protein
MYRIITLSITLSSYHIVTSHCQILVFAYFVFIFRGFQLILKICTFCTSTHCAICTVFCNYLYLRQIVIIIQMNAINEGFLFKLKLMPKLIALQLCRRNNPGVSILQLGLIFFINLSGRVERVNQQLWGSVAFVSWWSITKCWPTVKVNSGEEKAICTSTVQHTCYVERRHYECYLARFAFQNVTDCTIQFSQISASSKLTTKALETFCPSSWWLRQIGRPQLWILIQLWQKEGANFFEMLVFNSALT